MAGLSEFVRLRDYRPADHAAVIALDREVMAPLGLSRPIDHPRRRDLRELDRIYAHPTGGFLVGEADDGLVAMGGFLREEDGVARLKRLRVDLNWQRRGIARQLVGMLEIRAMEAGYRAIMLHVTERQPAALALYPRLGYRLTHTAKGDQGIDSYFRKELFHRPD
ncbi:MAG: GNAT family N-acetyltransferase [Inquilinus sp.]|nr:GNAT family N-acetyltransferase [Inquilinus sp.]